MTGYFSDITNVLDVPPEQARKLILKGEDATSFITEAIDVIGLLQQIAFDDETECPASSSVANRIGWVFSNLADLQYAIETIRYKAREALREQEEGADD